MGWDGVGSGGVGWVHSTSVLWREEGTLLSRDVNALEGKLSSIRSYLEWDGEVGWGGVWLNAIGVMGCALVRWVRMGVGVRVAV